MNSVTKVCRKCGTEIPADAPEGGCPSCLLQTALDSADGQKIFGRYTLVKVLGRGGMGIVWLARDEELERHVALKFLPDLMIQDRGLLNQLKHETKRCLELTHPHIVRIHDFVHDERSGCISMEYVDGETLSNLRAEKEHHVFEPHEIAGWIAQVCDALDYAHNRARVIHRDLKPSNLMVNQRGDLKITDFGIARSLADQATRLTSEQGGSGTLAYMSPQQLIGDRSTHLDDIYSLGATVYELLTSKPPFYSGNVDRQICERVAPSMTERRKEFNIEPAFVPKIWEEVVAACLAKDPARRPQSAADVTERLQLAPAKTRTTTARGKRSNRKAMLIASMAALFTVALVAWYFWPPPHPPAKPPPQASTIPEKSIAVLPFENLSDQKQNAYFTDGVQDEILTDLARVGDLKVISRTSVMQYRDVGTRNVREIAKELGVVHILEGTVQRIGDRVKISAQLIDARTDAHVWAATFDRSLADVFAVQSEVAFNIVNQLKAKLSSAEEAAIKQKPTNDLVAYDRFARAKALIESTVFSGRLKESLFEAAQLLDEATARDPTFLRAFCQLARVHDKIYILGLDHTPARVAMGDEVIKKAVAINRDAGEVHLAQANHLYCAYLDYDVARRELAIATRLLPNEPKCFELAGFMERRAGNWQEAVRQLSKALELDPRNVYLLQQLSLTYEHMRLFPEMAATIDRAIAIVPDDVSTRIGRGLVDLDWRADTKPMHAAIQQAIAKEPAIASEIADQWLYLAVCERDWVTAERVVATSSNACRIENVFFPKGWCEGFLAREQGDAVAARNALLAARTEGERIVLEQPNFGEALCALGMIEAALGDKDKAIAHGERAVQLVPVEKDAINGPLLVQYLSIIYSWTGHKDLAIKQLKRVATIPSTINYGLLRLHPFWDELRGDPRFEQIVTSLAPK